MSDEQDDLKLKKLVSDTYPRLEAKDVDLYIAECERRGIHPLSRLIVPRPNVKQQNGQWVRGGPPAWVTTIDLMRARADETGAYAPGQATTYEKGEKYPDRATVYVKKIVAGNVIEFSESADWEEFYPGDGKEGNMWRQMPRVMLSKVAEARALRRGWPAQLQGLYEDAEMDHANKTPDAPPPAQRATETPPKAANDSTPSSKVDQMPQFADPKDVQPFIIMKDALRLPMADAVKKYGAMQDYFMGKGKKFDDAGRQQLINFLDTAAAFFGRADDINGKKPLAEALLKVQKWSKSNAIFAQHMKQVCEKVGLPVDVVLDEEGAKQIIEFVKANESQPWDEVMAGETIEI